MTLAEHTQVQDGQIVSESASTSETDHATQNKSVQSAIENDLDEEMPNNAVQSQPMLPDAPNISYVPSSKKKKIFLPKLKKIQVSNIPAEHGWIAVLILYNVFTFYIT